MRTKIIISVVSFFLVLIPLGGLHMWAYKQDPITYVKTSVGDARNVCIDGVMYISYRHGRAITVKLNRESKVELCNE
jgi:hypothetical protein